MSDLGITSEDFVTYKDEVAAAVTLTLFRSEIKLLMKSEEILIL